MITLEQIKAARALIGWSQEDLSKHANLSKAGIAKIENGSNTPTMTTITKIIGAFDEADVEFLGTEGVRKRAGNIKTYKGIERFKIFMDDVYLTACNDGGDICLFNAKPENWLNLLGTEWCQQHGNRMIDVKDNYTFRALAEEQDDLLIGQSYIQYKWFPEALFNDRAFYCYGGKLAFMDFQENDVSIWVLNHTAFADGFRTLFQISWNHVGTDPTLDPSKDINKPSWKK